MLASIATVGLALGALGCTNTRPFLGEWQGSRILPALPGEDPYLRETLAKVVLSVRKDGTFQLREEGFQKEGTWAPSAAGLTLQIRSTLNRPLEPEAPMGGTRTLTLNGPGLRLERPGHEPVDLSRSKPHASNSRMP